LNVRSGRTRVTLPARAMALMAKPKATINAKVDMARS